MDLGRRGGSFVVSGGVFVLGLLLFFASSNLVSANFVFNVKRKFAKRERTLDALRAHDDRRHGRNLAVDLSLGGNGNPTDVGCASKQSGQLGTSSALDGILGFGQSNSSMLSQLALAGKVKKIFAHCLDGTNGGGIFAIGQVVQPKLNATPIIPNQTHYNVILKSIEVGDAVLQLPSDGFDTDSGKPMIMDSGTTLAYLGDELFNPLMTKILAAQPNLKLLRVQQQFTCFKFTGNVDDGFPAVTFSFENSLSLTVYPHEYLFQHRDDEWCIGWQNSGMKSKDGKELNLLGDMVLSNKLVVYDLENQTIGWSEYNCSLGIKVKDEQSGNDYQIGAKELSSACSMNTGWTLTLLSLLAILHSHL